MLENSTTVVLTCLEYPLYIFAEIHQSSRASEHLTLMYTMDGKYQVMSIRNIYSLFFKTCFTVIFTDIGKEILNALDNHSPTSINSPCWCHQMETYSALLVICAGNSTVPGKFPAQRPVTRSFGVFFDLRLNKRLSKHSWGWWFETPSRPLWRQSNEGCPPYICTSVN